MNEYRQIVLRSGFIYTSQDVSKFIGHVRTATTACFSMRSDGFRVFFLRR